MTAVKDRRRIRTLVLAGNHIQYSSIQIPNPTSNITSPETTSSDATRRPINNYWHLLAPYLPLLDHSPSMNSAIVVSWSIFSIACSVPGFAYLPPPIGSRTSLTPICRRREWEGSFRTCCSSPWQLQQQKQKNRHHRIVSDRSRGGVLNALARDVNGDIHVPPPPRKVTSGGRQSEYVSVQPMSCHIINSSFLVNVLFLLHLT